MSDGYFSEPTIAGQKVAFISEDDLWYVDYSVSTIAVRLTNSKGQVRNPIFNADGTKIVYSSNEFGGMELFLIDLGTSDFKRLTYLGKMSIPRFWDFEQNVIVFSSDYGRPSRGTYLYEISPDGGQSRRLPYGMTITYGRLGESVVLGRYQDDTARWKRYRGGTAGQIWYSQNGDNFEKLQFGSGNYVTPMLVGEYIYFISDFNGIANLFRTKSGEEPEQLTSADDYYFRRARTDGHRIVMQKGGSLFVFDPDSSSLEELEITYLSSREVRKPKFIQSPQNFVDGIVINAKDTHALVVTRGKPFYFPFFEEGTYQLGKLHGVRYKLPVFHPTKDLLYLICDELGEDGIQVFDLNNLSKKPEDIPANIGIPYFMVISPVGKHLAILNNRMEILVVDLETKQTKVVKKPNYGSLSSIDWSPDGQWLTYQMANSVNTTQVMVYSVAEDRNFPVTTGDFADYQPRFSPDGGHIYLLSNRSYYPTVDPHLFQYDFPKPTKIYVIKLQKGGKDPAHLEPRPLVDQPAKKSDKGDKTPDSSETPEVPEVTIDFDGIFDRIVEMPIPNNKIHQLAITEDRILYRTSPVKGMNPNLFGEDKPDHTLHAYILKSGKEEVVANGIRGFSLSGSCKTLILHQDKKHRLVPSTHLAKADQVTQEKKTKREEGYLDFGRIKLKIDPHAEWEQMIKETWKLMKDHYWEESLAGLNWELMLEKYLQLVSKISSRSEFSDLMWELQAESRTSHSYEFGGDYEFPPNYAPAYLGGEYEYDSSENAYRITHLLKGDVFDRNSGSPLVQAGLAVDDLIYEIDGQVVGLQTTIQELLMGKKGQEVYLKVRQAGEQRTISVKPVANDYPLRYRDWVEANRRYVHDKTDGKVGYFHIPDMFFSGLQEFYRYFPVESAYEGLIVDVRYNGGGHTSELFLEKLARKHLGYSIPRYGKKSPYPSYSVRGPMIALTNQSAGSDGDIFSHSFKMLGLGKLIGTRTWGGVIGIWPKVRLVDGTTVTQPEYSFWFNDVGYEVENYGTDPDIEVDITPNDDIKGIDTQLERGVEEILRQLQDSPVVEPDLSDKPIKS